MAKNFTLQKVCPCNIQRFFKVVKNETFQLKNFDIFLIISQNIDCGYTLNRLANLGQK